MIEAMRANRPDSEVKAQVFKLLGLFGLLAACVALSGCATTSQGDGTGAANNSGTNSDYWVTSDFTPFFRMGPQQPSGPDQSLKKETRLTLSRKSYGYSEVILEDGTSGWVANDDIRPIPAEVLKSEQDLMAMGSPGRGRPKSTAVVEYNDPDISMPPPEELILPDSTATPVIKPDFRY